MKRWLHSDALFYTGWTIIAVALIFGLVPEARVFAVDQYESVAFAVDPTAARAFAYGEVHFDATDDPTYYDLDRAQMFFEKAAAIDPTYPYLYHELARVAFLQGNLPLALARINFQISMHGNSEPNSYYVRGLIEGYMGDYSDAANDYAHFLQFDPTDWAAMNDDAWVLLKAQRYQAALSITTRGLAFQPDNPWLLNSYATALYQLGDYKQALAAAQQAQAEVSTLTDAEWSHAYPGNDPSIAPQGVASFQEAVAANIRSITLALGTSTVQLAQ